MEATEVQELGSLRGVSNKAASRRGSEGCLTNVEVVLMDLQGQIVGRETCKAFKVSSAHNCRMLRPESCAIPSPCVSSTCSALDTAGG